MLNASDMALDIDDRIKYKNCKPGDPKGVIVCEVTASSGSKLIKTVRWDGVHKTETDAILEMHTFIRTVQ